MILVDIKNGQHFCLEDNPKRIFQRIRERTKLYSDFDHRGFDVGETRNVVIAQCLETHSLTTFQYPRKTKVIALGAK